MCVFGEELPIYKKQIKNTMIAPRKLRIQSYISNLLSIPNEKNFDSDVSYQKKDLIIDLIIQLKRRIFLQCQRGYNQN